MKVTVLKFGLVLAAMGACTMAEAQPEEGQGKKGKGPQGPSREEVLQKYDTDGDGQLSDAELEVLKNDRAAEREKRAAEGGGEEMRGGRGGPEGRGERPSREEMIKKFDKDGDGELNEEERAEARKYMQKHGRKGRGKQMMEKYDTDGDGQLSEEERAAARADMEKRRAEREAQQGGAPDA